ncbi:MAG: glycosyltransferase [bacterium]
MPERIKVTYLTDKLAYGGTPLQIVELATHLNPEQFQPHAIALSVVDSALREHLHQRGIAVDLIGRAHWVHPGAVAGAAKLFRVLKKANPHILHAFLTTSNVLGALIGKLARVPVVISSHRDLGGFDGKWITRANRWTDRNLTDCVTANSQAVRQALVHRAGLDSIEVLHNGIDLDTIYRAKNGMAKREALGLQPDEVAVAMVANIRPAKGHRFALQAFQRIAQEIPNAKLLFCGAEVDAAYSADLRKSVIETGFEDRVKFLGARPDIPEIMHAIDVLLAPSLSEGFSNTILEAMAAGKVVIASSVGGNSEQIVDGETGYLVPPSDTKILTDRLLHLLKSPKKRREMGKAARKIAEERFSLDRMVTNHQRLYRRLVNGSADFKE